MDTTTAVEKSFYTFALEYYSKEPTIANVIVLLFFSTPLIIGVCRFLNKRQAKQVEENTHIRDHAFRMRERKK